MNEIPDQPTQLTVRFEFPDQLTATRGAPEVLRRLGEVAESVGATLLPQEATINEQKTTLSEEELRLAEFESRLNPNVDLFDSDVQRRLDTPLAQLLQSKRGGQHQSSRTRLVRALQNESLISVRDIFVQGMFAAHDTRGVGGEMIVILRAELAGLVPEIPLMDITTPAIAARFCDSLHQILALYDSKRLTVADLVACPDEQTASERYGISGYQLANARDYAAAFEAARQSR